ncbi:low specificity L-threonine aldolase [Mesorhizobium sp. CN5-321]|uniref:threonine aldolase family protein n=1 Tax=Mesorhizobium hunchu TaxID=3157708 RepID=UPI0032B81DC8
MFFASDNWAGAHPRIADSLSANAEGFAAAYGNGSLDKAVAERFNEIFEREVSVFFVATGTAANSLAMASLTRPGGIVLAHREAHMIEDESGAPEYLTGGARVKPVDGALGRIEPALLDRAIRQPATRFPHGGQAVAVSITQSTESGTVYSLEEIEAIGAIARGHGLPFHMDGARFANALVSLGTTPAEMTWKRGVDVLSFGGTKNGCWCAEAVVFMDPKAAKEFPFLRMRAGQLFSKSRFVAAQFDAYLKDGLWLETARHSNALAAQLAKAIEGSGLARLGWKPQANEVFAVIRSEAAERLKKAGAVFYEWDAPAGLDLAADERLFRFVTSFATTQQDVDRFAELIA